MKTKKKQTINEQLRQLANSRELSASEELAIFTNELQQQGLVSYNPKTQEKAEEEAYQTRLRFEEEQRKRKYIYYAGAGYGSGAGAGFPYTLPYHLS
jgi:fructoselysine-6-P-deglycase FrlB-like protein